MAAHGREEDNVTDSDCVRDDPHSKNGSRVAGLYRHGLECDAGVGDHTHIHTTTTTTKKRTPSL